MKIAKVNKIKPVTILYRFNSACVFKVFIVKLSRSAPHLRLLSNSTRTNSVKSWCSLSCFKIFLFRCSVCLK